MASWGRWSTARHSDAGNLFARCEVLPGGDAIDCGQHVAMGVNVDVPGGEWTECVQVIDTNPAEGQCAVEGEDADAKTYCPGIGLVQDQELELVDYNFVRRSRKLPGRKLMIK